MALSSRVNSIIDLILAEEEDETLAYGEDQVVDLAIDNRWCLVGRFLTERNIDFDAMPHLIASLWQPGKVFQRLKKGEDPKLIPLSHVDMWIQLHDIQLGFKIAQVCKGLGNYIGNFVEADQKNFMGLWRDYLRIQVTLDVSKPLKRRKKICTLAGEEFWVNFKYEHVPTFYFICRIMGHSEGFRPRLFDIPKDRIVKPYGIWIKATPRRKNTTMGSKWLRSFQDFFDEKVSGDDSTRTTEVLGNNHYVPMLVEGIVGQPSFAHNSGFNGKEAVGGLDTDSQHDELTQDTIVITDTKRKTIEVEVTGIGASRVGQMGLDVNSFVSHELGPSGEVDSDVEEVFTEDITNDLPWCIMGDMNNVLSQEDKRGGNNYPDWLLRRFQQAVSDCELQDIKLIGHPFIWGKGRGTDHWIEQKIKYCGEILLDWGEAYSAKGKFEEILTQREVFWRQRSKQLWLQVGDNNSKFFHASASARRRSNLITKLQDSNGVWTSWDDGLDRVMVDYFMDLFTASGTNSLDVINCIHPNITAPQNVEFLRPVTEEEVKAALFQMHPDKSPDPNGMTSCFFKKCWNVAKNDIVRQVQDFSLTGSLPLSINHTNIVLIPKKKQPTVMGDLRPISMCNVIYKVVSKVLANRLKVVLPIVISDTQSAFLPGRLISYNILVLFEIMHYLKRKTKGKDGFMALKLDMSKAYDRLEWGYRQAILLRMGFDGRWVSWDLLFRVVGLDRGIHYPSTCLSCVEKAYLLLFGIMRRLV
uniref:Reverse transcriptase domain-containing protein n=1 Tax=Cannabis sativa TaxID=3483 RepID=A0A803Q0P4_CANSA